MTERKTLGPGARASWDFLPPFPVAQCVSIFIGAPERSELSVASVTIGGEEQLLGEGVPAEFLREAPLQLDRQRAGVPLVVTLRNDGDVATFAEIVVEFVPVEAMTIAKGRLH